GIRDGHMTGVQTCALPISKSLRNSPRSPLKSLPGFWKCVVLRVKTSRPGNVIETHEHAGDFKGERGLFRRDFAPKRGWTCSLARSEERRVGKECGRRRSRG